MFVSLIVSQLLFPYSVNNFSSLKQDSDYCLTPPSYILSIDFGKILSQSFHFQAEVFHLEAMNDAVLDDFRFVLCEKTFKNHE